MGNIVLLDDLTINKIAAGEVIERPANVVKELVENSIDADATNITIEIKKGGKEYIKITDNGKGIARDDIAISLERHATSKLRKIEDLENIYSMGFRGEALASISSISKLTMISRTKEDNTGIKTVAEAGNIVSQEEVSANIGTTIIVENIFFNTPVRYKFLKQDSTESRYIKEFIQKVALANKNIAIKLFIDSKKVFQTTGNGKIKDVIYQIYGKDIAENIEEVEYESDNIKITGVVGNTLIAKDSRKGQITFLNNRPIYSKILASSGDQAFQSSIGIGKYGFYILNLEMPATYYDINVHPTKKEVRFEDENKIYKAFYNALKTAMLNKEFLGNTDIEKDKKEYVEKEFNFVTKHFNQEQEAKITEDVREREEKRKINYKFIGILFKTYIIVEIDDELYFIDQHAAHERLLYEEIRENYKNHLQNNTQMMLIPEMLTLTHKEMDFIIHNLRLIKDYGFDIELFGENSVKINGMPELDYKTNSKNIFLEILDEMITNERTNNKSVEERFIATVACKAAVKAGMDLTALEVDNLIQKLLNLKDPYTCPHGRPTTVKFTKKELEKMKK